MSEGLVCYFTITSSDGAPTSSHIISQNNFVIGRSQSANVTILSAGISREHLKVEFNNKNIKVTDLGSANGTSIDGKPLKPDVPTLIQPQNVIQLGTEDIHLQFQVLVRPQEMKALDQHKQEIQSQMGRTLKDMEASAKEDIENKKRLASQQIEEYAQEALKRAQQESQKIIERAHEEAQGIKQNAINESKSHLEKTSLQVNQLRLDAKQEAQNIIEQAQQSSSELKQETQRSVNKILEETDRLVRSKQTEIDAQMERLTESAQKKSLEILKQADEKANLTLSEASISARKLKGSVQVEIKQIKDRAQAEALEITQRASQRAEELIYEAQKQAEERVQSRTKENEEYIEDFKQKFLSQMEAEKIEMIELAKKEAHKRQKEVLAQYEEEIAKKQGHLRSQDTEILEMSHRRESLNKNIESLSALLVQQTEKTENQKAISEALEQKINSQQGVLSKLADAEKHENQLKEQILALEEQSEKIKKENQFNQQKAQEDHSALINKLLVEQEKKKEDLISELDRQKLQMLKKLEDEHHQEEFRLKQLRKHQVTDIARSIEVHVVEKLEKLIPQGSTQHISDLSASIFDIVTRYMSDQSSIVEVQTQTQKAEVAHKQEKRVGNFKRIAAVLVLVVLGLSFVYRSELHSTYRKLAHANAGKEFAEERRKLGEFKPEQDDTYRNTYMDNVLYYRNYTKQKLSEEHLQAWTHKLSDVDFLTKNGLSEEDIIYFVAAETNMVKRLEEMKIRIDKVYLNEELERIRQAENEDHARLVRILKTEKNYRKVKELERDFFQQLRAPASHSSSEQMSPPVDLSVDQATGAPKD